MLTAYTTEHASPYLPAEAMLLVDVDFAVSLSLAKIVEEEASYNRLISMLHARCVRALPHLRHCRRALPGVCAQRAARPILGPGAHAARALHHPPAHCPRGCLAAPLTCRACPAPRPTGTRWCCPPLRRKTTARRGGRWRLTQCARASPTSSTNSSECPPPAPPLAACAPSSGAPGCATTRHGSAGLPPQPCQGIRWPTSAAVPRRGRGPTRPNPTPHPPCQVERRVWLPRAAVPSGPPGHRLLALDQEPCRLPGAVPGAPAGREVPAAAWSTARDVVSAWLRLLALAAGFPPLLALHPPSCQHPSFAYIAFRRLVYADRV